MGGDAAWLRSAIGVADAATQGLGLREDVTLEAALQADAFGTVTEYAAPARLSALVQRKRGVLQTAGGQEIKYQAIVGFVGPVDIGPRDRLKLWDGVTGQLFIPEGGLSDPTTGQPYNRTVYLRR